MPQQIPRMPSPIHPMTAGLSRVDPRHQLEREVALRFRDVERQLSAQALNISARGMFIRARDARPAGSPVSFELSLSRAEQRIRGDGEVVWMRQFELAADRPAGMGIRFVDLDAESRRALQSFIAEQTRDEAPSSSAGKDGWEASTFLNPLSSLTSSEQHKLYAFAGYASAKPRREWNRRIRHALSRTARALLGR